MKFKSLILTLFCVGLYAQGVHQDVKVLTPEGSETFRIKYNAVDTSATFPIFEIMSARFWVGDSIGGATDSAYVTFTFQIGPGGNATGVMAGYTTVESWVVSTDSTISTQMITDNAIPNGSLGRYILTGSTANRQKWGGSLAKIIHMNYESSPRNR
jgi:hypothetical protein